MKMQTALTTKSPI